MNTLEAPVEGWVLSDMEVHDSDRTNCANHLVQLFNAEPSGSFANMMKDSIYWIWFGKIGGNPKMMLEVSDRMKMMNAVVNEFNYRFKELAVLVYSGLQSYEDYKSKTWLHHEFYYNQELIRVIKLIILIGTQFRPYAPYDYSTVREIVRNRLHALPLHRHFVINTLFK